jgi:membrane fusion protein, multidrug efflux system
VKIVRAPETPAKPHEAPSAREAPLAPVAADTPQPSPARPRRFGRILLGLAVIAVLAFGGQWAHRWWTVSRFVISTDDAYVRAEVSTIATKIGGYVAAIGVRNGDVVRAGDVIARIDEGDYVLAVEAARNRVETQRATIDRLARQVDAARAAVAQSAGQISGARADAARATADFNRYAALAERDFASRSRLDQARADREKAIAAVSWAETALTTARANVDVAAAQTIEAEKVLAELRTALARADRDREFTLIRAPFDGVIGNKAVQAGDFVQPAARIVALVPLDRIWIEANFKETQITRLKPGQLVEIAVDALPDRLFTGQIESFSPASGAVFSLLPPENATGNFTKIVQRVPLRVSVPAEVAAAGILRPGLSVVVRVDTKADVLSGAVAAPR